MVVAMKGKPPHTLLQSLLNPNRMFSALLFRYQDQIHLKAKAQGCESLDKPFQVQYAPCTDAERTSGNKKTLDPSPVVSTSISLPCWYTRTSSLHPTGDRQGPGPRGRSGRWAHCHLEYLKHELRVKWPLSQLIDGGIS